jgi:hypothetical protein
VATDRYAGTGEDLEAPSAQLAAITPSDTAVLPIFSKAIYVGGNYPGDITLTAVEDSASVTLSRLCQSAPCCAFGPSRFLRPARRRPISYFYKAASPG